ncbi:glycine cleavage system aminomethyltransferase GcvT [Aneurinibacillus uraniidurans]|uniref:glycine cleavage system aminomethyltransferase GcvT n=1 Tax=Aneurinibacillus uraniidurans TaxID=2966586 RepID=UPI0023493F7C|nr:glycine cleavage system aminomethyltransferase GcvT [Aneurinibacillus sp. B1]WCN38887.1 glycine cleavage system aminomethyltransferase GcvT [Aneurinibacillus sp. B1]
MTKLRRTPLYALYEKYGARTIDFGGWELPVQFAGIQHEHERVRTKAGLFDVSHMGEIEISGRDAPAFLQKMMTNDVSRLMTGCAQYTLMCTPNGGTVDDLLVYKRSEQEYLLVVNAANTEKDEAWLNKHVTGDVVIKNVSDEMAQLALQGPLAERILQQLTAEPIAAIRPFCFREHVQIGAVRTLISRTGYTGEDGFELYVGVEDAPKLWTQILDEGGKDVMPCGLGARDTLRFEARLPLYGQELSESITPLEAGLGFAVKLEKPMSFIGQEALRRQKEAGVSRKLVGIEMTGRGIPRTGYAVYAGDQVIGDVTTGTQSPTFKKNIGLALVQAVHSTPGTEVTVEIRGKKVAAVVVPTPFYKRINP